MVNGFEIFEYLIVVPVEGSIEESSWLPGPYPVALPNGTVADTENRRTYFDERAASVLYGVRPGCRRLFREYGTPFGSSLWELTAAELVALEDGHGPGAAFLVLHVHSDADVSTSDLALLSRVGSSDDVVDAWLRREFGTSITTRAGTKRGFTVAFAASHGVESASIAGTGWSSEEADLWLLASLTPPGSFGPPTSSARDFLPHLMPLSSDWSALVLRDGTAFLWIASEQQEFLAAARSYVASIYLDALLLGLLQNVMLGQMADEIAALEAPTESLGRIIDLEVQLSSFRSGVWWNHITSHGIANSLLRAYQDEHSLQALHDQIVAQLQDFSRQAQLVSEIAVAESARRTNRLLALLAILGIPLAVGQLTAALAVEQPIVLVVSLGATLIAIMLLLLTPGARALRSRRGEERGS